MNRFIIKKW